MGSWVHGFMGSWVHGFMGYLPRTVDSEFDELLPDVSAIALDGPKGVGKTATAQRRASTEWRLDDPAQREMARADFGLTSVPDGTLLIDEWQHLPQVWDAVRRQVDVGVPPGRFLLTGSATPVDAAGAHSGAGRILSLRMRPMALHERGLVTPTVSLSRLLTGTQGEVSGRSQFTLASYVEAVVSSGFPGNAGVSARARRQLLDSYLQRVIDRDLPDQGFEVRRPEVLRRWLAAYAAASSTPTSYSKLLDATTGGDGSQPAKTTTAAYREVGLIVEGPEGNVLAIEVKLAGAVSDSDVRHLLWLREQIPERVVDLLVVSTGPAAYRRPDGVAVVPLSLLGA